MRLSRSSSSRLSRRPSLSATISTRCGVASMWRCRFCSGSGAPRSTLPGRAAGAPRRLGSSSALAGGDGHVGAGELARQGLFESPALHSAHPVNKASALRNRSSGGRIGPLAVVLQEAVALAGVGPEALQRRVDLAVQHQRPSRARGSRRPSRWRRRTAAGSTRCRRWRCRCRCPCRCAPCSGRLPALAPAGAERVARRFVHRELAAGQQAHFGHRVQAALACRGRRCGSNRSRRRTGRPGRARPSPSGTGRSARRAPRIRRARRPGSRGCSRPA